jgi:transposase
MVTPPDIEAQILRFYHAEKWTVGTIARQLHIHHGVVQRVLAQAGVPWIGRLARGSQIDAYLPFIRQTLETFPTLTASRLYTMVLERGYPGRPDHFRHLIAQYRPRPKAEAYLRLRTLLGEEGQVDWGHFGHLEIGRARRPLMAFVMVLSYSRQIFLRFFLDARMENFLRGHVAAFEAWQGVPRVLLYDNLKSAVLERRGDAIRFNPTLLSFAGHYRYEPRPVAIARGNEKVAWKEASSSYVDHSSRPDCSLTWTISTPRPRPGAMGSLPIGAVPKTRNAASERYSPKKRRACCRCRTIRRRRSNASRSRSAKPPMGAAINRRAPWAPTRAMDRSLWRPGDVHPLKSWFGPVIFDNDPEANRSSWRGR